MNDVRGAQTSRIDTRYMLKIHFEDFVIYLFCSRELIWL